MDIPPITFFIHRKYWPKREPPLSADCPWSGFNFGIYTWTIQTYLRLRRRGLPCKLSPDVPTEGIVFAHRECAVVDGERLVPGPRTLLVCMAADLALYPPANLQIVQNPEQARWFPNCYYVTHWPEPGLVPRDESRRHCFQNIAFVGNTKNADAELLSDGWRSTLERNGFTWILRQGAFNYADPSRYEPYSIWGNYREIDAVVAVRRFLPHHPFNYAHKPPSKLVNAWLAGVPAVLGCESAFLHLRRSQVDYIDVHTPEETLESLITLRQNSDLREAMIANGRRRALEVSSARIEEEWIRFIQEIAVPAYHRWLSEAAWKRSLLTAVREFDHAAMRVRKKVLISVD